MTLTKTELRTQEHKLTQLQKYLPTLQLKKMLLQMEVQAARAEFEEQQARFTAEKEQAVSYTSLLTSSDATFLFPAIKPKQIEKKHENIAGVDLPILERITFEPNDNLLFDSPVWFDAAIANLRALITAGEKVAVAEERTKALEKELREVSIRVNLFEKKLIPEAKETIRKIKIFLGDLQLAAICQAKLAKKKIEAAR